jgi:DNA-binding response OmpR family regulator
VDIVLLDVAMPDIDGIALLQRLRATPDYLELPIVMLTASPDERKRIQAIAAGANAYLNKIASPRELIDTVDALLQKASKSVF